MSIYKKDGLLKYHDWPHSPHGIIPPYIESHSTVLDVGCNTGYIAQILLKNKCKTDGIDINEQALKKAQKYCVHTYRRDLYLNKLSLPQKKYDYILFVDVLEHLPQPDMVLADSLKYLKKSGRVIICLPNIARFEIRLKLLLGHFDYAPGIMSPDHLRFYTHDSASQMIQESGLMIEESIPTGLGHIVHIFPKLTAFQFVYICTLK
jgi:2-polyprenyl-3-methyl-5-hydroxy-6-metoxy-1,4-benzoquinol methylase